MTRARYLLALACLFLPSATMADAFVCHGDAPAWRLDFDAEHARFDFPAPTEMEVMNDVPAEGADWPRAFTLIGDRDTAIVVLERETCGAGPYRAHVLTQRGQTPILLTGCCAATE